MEKKAYTFVSNYKNQKEVFEDIKVQTLKAIEYEKKECLESSLCLNKKALHLITISVLHEKLHNHTKKILKCYAVKLRKKICIIQSKILQQNLTPNEVGASLDCLSLGSLEEGEEQELDKKYYCAGQYVLHYFLLYECETIFSNLFMQDYPNFEDEKQDLFRVFHEEFHRSTACKYLLVDSLEDKLKELFEKKFNYKQLNEAEKSNKLSLSVNSGLQRSWNKSIQANTIESEEDFCSYESTPAQMSRPTTDELYSQLLHEKNKLNQVIQVIIIY